MIREDLINVVPNCLCQLQRKSHLLDVYFRSTEGADCAVGLSHPQSPEVTLFIGCLLPGGFASGPRAHFDLRHEIGSLFHTRHSSAWLVLQVGRGTFLCSTPSDKRHLFLVFKLSSFMLWLAWLHNDEPLDVRKWTFSAVKALFSRWSAKCISGCLSSSA